MIGSNGSTRWRRALCALLVMGLAAAAGCSEDETATGGTADATLEAPDADDTPPQDTAAPEDTSGEEDTGEAPDTGEQDTAPDVEEDTSPPPPQVTRFIVMGDTGEGNPEQLRVAQGAQARCDRAGGCDGFLMLGDNIYDTGPESATDPQFTTKVDEPYRGLKLGPPPADGEPDNRERMPIYVSLGNHDLGGAGLNRDLIQHYIDYAAQNDWFYFPSAWWEKKVGNVHLMALETNSLAYLGTKYDDHGQMVEGVLSSTDARWTIAFGHHPYRSDGQHGNAGSYEGIPGDLTINGGEFRKWIDEFVCNRVDFYLSGHDHNRQWFNSVPDIPTWPFWEDDTRPCNSWFAVSGAGAKLRGMKDRDNDLAFGEATLGFLFMEFHENKVVAEYCDADGNTEWTRTLTGH
ncbi:hypothetical protein FIV42_06120 [Persicimonas caeni]|uniref:Calcineurin-like phosphoesterase domain-containing protein n=1 Tax=Persicimonas caeni TaxID=2292766 RepID=A0A4Y6PQ32_PERCE|nr:metallophosphoesterase [Persicimonas caeni]QDG50323.1 hypothetical protein FIV42_06120 [Persicimonas caeni]QED31544.1 hypothetical protein FRD00_06115 [Persicimonas caeni]